MSTTNADVDARRKKILALLQKDEKVKVTSLSELFAISEVSIRNDLRELEIAGHLKRIHGGAISMPHANTDLSFQQKLEQKIEEKKKVAVEAAKLVREGDFVILDSGTTAVHLARQLTNYRDIIIITNSIPITIELGAVPDIDIILLGGNYHVDYKSVGGPDAIRQLRRYKATKLFLGADGITASEGLTTARVFEAEMCAAMMEQAEETIVIADYTKLGFVGFTSINPISRVDVLITDSKADMTEVKNIKAAGVKVVIAN